MSTTPEGKEALAGCPHCGATASGYGIEPHEHALRLGDFKMAAHFGSYVIEGDCACGSGLIGATREEVTERWNRRAATPSALSAAHEGERTAFEDWFCDHGPEMGDDSNPFARSVFSGDYEVWSVNRQWMAWQARGALAAPQSLAPEAVLVDAAFRELLERVAGRLHKAQLFGLATELRTALATLSTGKGVA